MTEIREIGLEKEIFLLNKQGEIMEPSMYGFPADEMGFLIEIRSLPSDRFYPVYMTIHQEELQYKLRADKFGMHTVPDTNMYATPEFVANIIAKYKILEFTDFTNNIYNKHGIDGPEEHKSHHLGIFSEPGTNCSKLTAGIHVHFSSRDSETGEVLELPYKSIVKQMDEVFEKEISESKRIKGEYEFKKHGFEYRSLPCNADIYKVLKESFKILRSV